MITFNEAKPVLQKIIDSLTTTINVEVAIFDKNCHLIVCTENYLKFKGKAVHTPSIEESLMYGKVLVNQPGSMPSCIGCRFKDNCPSTIEMLNCIKINNYSLGVVCLTSFTQEGHIRISQNPAVFSELLQQISELISTILIQGYGKKQFEYLDTMLQTTINVCKEPVIAVDNKGLITHCNSSALNMFSFCNLSTASLHSILPHFIIKDILQGNFITNKYIVTEYFSGYFSSVPIRLENNFLGSVIHVENFALQDKKYKNKSSLPIDQGKMFLDKIIGGGKQITSLKQALTQFAHGSSTVLITGETGTGKELFAKAIHYNSNRKKHPFVSINCASIPESLLESELFGYDEGAFTGAKKGGKPGRFEMAQGGTIFLDEIGEMPIYMQSKLLRVLQDYTLERVGSIRSIALDIRVIAATNQDLETLIKEKKFRSDLYYRLNVIPLHLPPLRSRLEDIDDLCNYFLQKYNTMLNKSIKGFSKDAINLFKSYHWPGNVRELENTVEYLINMVNSEFVKLDHLPKKFLQDSYSLNAPASEPLIKGVEMVVIETLLNQYGWDVNGKTKVAEELGISLRTLYRRINNLKVQE